MSPGRFFLVVSSILVVVGSVVGFLASSDAPYPLCQKYEAWKAMPDGNLAKSAASNALVAEIALRFGPPASQRMTQTAVLEFLCKEEPAEAPEPGPQSTEAP